MSSAYNLSDYKNRYFEWKELTKIYGHPTIESIVQILRQFKINAQRVPTSLVGGQLEYLALFIPPTIYITIPGATQFVRPTDPGELTLTALTDVGTRLRAAQPIPLVTADIATQKIAHKERKRQYNEYQAVK